MSRETLSGAGPMELLGQLARAGARVQRELSRDEVLRCACESLSAIGLRCSITQPVDGGMRVQEVNLGARLAAVEAALGTQVVGTVRPFTPFVQRIWNDGGAYTDQWPDEVALFMGAQVPAVVDGIAEGGFTHGIGVRVAEAGTPGLMLFSTGPWLREEDLGAFRLFALQLGAALDAARTVERLQERNSELATLNRLAALASTEEELGPMLDAAALLIEEAAGASAAGIVVLPSSSGAPQHVHAHGRKRDFAPMLGRAAAVDAVFRDTLRGGEIRVAHAEELPAEVAAYWTAVGFQTGALVPLRSRGALMGAMAVMFDDRRGTDACHLDLLGAIAGQLGAAIANHDHLESSRRRIAELTLLNDIAAATVALDPVLLLESTMRRVATTFGAEAGSAYVEERGAFRLVASVGHASLLEAPPIGERDPTSVAVALKRPIRFPEDLEETPRIRWFREHEGVRSAAAVPMLAKDRTVGCFVLSRRSEAPFTGDDLRLLSGVGVQLGVAVDNARLYEDLRRSYAALGRAQEQLIQQERLAALGQLAAVIAHEVRNPLGAVFNALGSLRRLLQPSGDPKMLLDIIEEESDRLNRIVGDLLDFARPAPAALRPEPLDRVVDDALQSAGLDPRIRVEREVPPGLPPVPMDARLIRQALLNLLTNAVQAMPGGGTLSIAARLDRDAVRLEISDTGDGVPEDVRQRIFEPFFTTRPTGTGLGLAVVKRILDDHCATIGVEARSREGTRFVLRLPLSVGGPAREAVEPTPSGE